MRKSKQAKVLQFSRKTDSEIGIPDFPFPPTVNEKIKGGKHHRKQ